MMRNQSSSITTKEEVLSNQRQSADEVDMKQHNDSHSIIPMIDFEEHVEIKKLFDKNPISSEGERRRSILTPYANNPFTLKSLRMCEMDEDDACAAGAGSKIEISTFDCIREDTFSSPTTSAPPPPPSVPTFSVLIDWSGVQFSVDPASLCYVSNDDEDDAVSESDESIDSIEVEKKRRSRKRAIAEGSNSTTRLRQTEDKENPV